MSETLVLDILENGKERHIRSEESSFQVGKKTAVTVVHSSPERSEDITHDRPVMFVPGIAEYAEGALGLSVRELAKRGYDVWAFSEPASSEDLSKSFLIQQRKAMLEKAREGYQGGKWNDHFLARLLREENIPLQLFREAYVLILAIEKTALKDGKKGRVDIVAHSKGTAAAVIAAMLRPDLFGRLVLANPVGRVERSFIGMTWSYLVNEMLREIIIPLSKSEGKEREALMRISDDLRRFAKENPDQGITTFPKMFGELFGRMVIPWPGGKALGQSAEMAAFNADSFLIALNILAPEIERITVFDTDDSIAPADEINSKVASKEKGDLGEHIETSGFHHFGIVKDAARYAVILDEALKTKF